MKKYPKLVKQFLLVEVRIDPGLKEKLVEIPPMLPLLRMTVTMISHQHKLTLKASHAT